MPSFLAVNVGVQAHFFSGLASHFGNRPDRDFASVLEFEGALLSMFGERFNRSRDIRLLHFVQFLDRLLHQQAQVVGANTVLDAA